MIHTGVASEVSAAIRAAWTDLNHDMVDVLRALPEARKLTMVGELADFARECVGLQVRGSQPTATEADVRSQVVARMLEGGHGRG